ncbi:MAG: prepilin-type N-terminal cleavage/methylation domain-containing protein [Spirochaetales bacterium]|jgi:type IV pilus assembly protein PilW|nr:prepilin-type N-terminal cleavage/methylation domain-containing protein [Spirochaetales bacterium]
MRMYLKSMNKGFTLIELLIAMAISGVIMTGVYSAFKSQQDSYLAQEQVAEMQQTIRASLDIMTREIRMAGFRGVADSDANIKDAQIDAIYFSLDINEDGNTTDDDDDDGENIGYDLYDSATTGPLTLGRSSSKSLITLTETPASSGHYEALYHQPFAQNIEELEFFYTLEDGSKTTAPATPSEIRSVQISILARANKPDRNYTNTQTYTSASLVDWTPATPDNFRRRFQTMTVNCRNMGL